MLSNSSKSSNIHQIYLYINRSQKTTYLYINRSQKTTCPCLPTCHSEVTYINHIYTQWSEVRRQLVCVVQLLRVVQLVKIRIHQTYLYTIKARRQLVHFVSKLSNIHQTYLYINRSQKITRLCSQTNQSQVTYIKHMYLYTIRGKKTTCLCPPNSSVLSNSSKWENYINLSVSSNLSKSSYIHQTFLNTIRS